MGRKRSFSEWGEVRKRVTLMGNSSSKKNKETGWILDLVRGTCISGNSRSTCGLFLNVSSYVLL